MTENEITKWIADAKAAGWHGIADIIQATIDVNGERGKGLWRCECCDAPVTDPAVCDDGDCVLLTAQDGIGVTSLCGDCYEAAVDARAKIVIHQDEEDGCEVWEEDYSALSDEERNLAQYLDHADAGCARQARDIIAGYPRDQRRDLHRYQDAIDRERSLRGKTVD